jgi:hypothetical protein
MTKMIKAISWYDIINFIFKLKIQLFLWIYNAIMKLQLFWTIGEFKMLLPLTLDSRLEKKSFFS